MSLLAAYPELARYAMTEMRRPRLLIAAVASLFIGACLLCLEAALPKGKPLRLYDWAFLIQASVILLYGTSRATGSVISERAEKTWDIQRLTPQSSFELAVGKLLGAPIFAYYFAALMLPWAIIGYCLSDKLDLAAVLGHYAALFSLGFLTFSIGLLVSAHSAEASAGSSFNTAGALTGFLAFFGIIQFVYGESLPWKEPIMYFGLPWPPRRLLCMSVMALGLWALLGAKWRIGSDLREGRRFWRLPAFLAFLVFYQVGFEKINLYLSAIIPAFIAFFAATLNSERRDHWRRWLSGSGHWLHDIPTWIIACASYGILALLLVFIGKASGAETLFWRYPLLQTCFLVRDCAFMQVCRFTKIRRPEVTALILIGLAYLLSPIVLIGLAALLPPIVFNAAPIENPLRLTCLFAPLVLEDAGAFADFLSGLIQAAGALWLLSSSIRRQRLAQAYQEF